MKLSQLLYQLKNLNPDLDVIIAHGNEWDTFSEVDSLSAEEYERGTVYTCTKERENCIVLWIK